MTSESTDEPGITSVALIGSETVAAAIEFHLESTSITTRRSSLTEASDADVAVVSGAVETDRFDVVASPEFVRPPTLLTVELGGLGGAEIDGVVAALGTFGPDGPCYRCLRSRVRANEPEREVTDTHVEGGLEGVMGSIAGLRLLQGTTAHRTATIVEYPFAVRNILPVPGCPQCDPDWRGRWDPRCVSDDGQRPLDDAVAAAEQALDAHVGIVGSVGEVTAIPLAYYLAELSDTSYFSDATAPRRAAGVSDDWNEAFMRAMGEALERYAAGVYDETDLRGLNEGRADTPIPIEDVVRPDGWDTVGGSDALWIPATDLHDGTVVAVPAELALFPPPERRIRPAITTGLGLGNSPAEAILSGLTEVIERDAAMLAWYSTYEPLGLTVEDDRYDRMARRAAVEDLSVSTVLLTQDVDLPVVAAAVHRESAWPRFAIGSAAGFDARTTALDALREAIQNWTELNEMGRAKAMEEASRIASYADDPDSVLPFVKPDRSIRPDDVSRQLPSTLSEAVDALVALVTEADLRPVATWLTPRDLEILGFTAVRIIAPTAQPLFTGTAYFGDRLEEVPAEMGYEPRPDRRAHPFP